MGEPVGLSRDWFKKSLVKNWPHDVGLAAARNKMSKISLDIDLTWPDGKTKVFVPGEKLDAAWLPDSVKDWHLYAEAYREAAETVFQEWCTSKVHRDHLVFPLVFLYRHYVELRLKETLQAASRLLELPQDWKCDHRLDNLWKRLRPLIDRIWPDAPKADGDHVEAMIREFSERDAVAMEFRYPVTKEGKRTLTDLERLDVHNFHSAMKQLAAFLDGVSEGIAVYQQEQP
ncbi:MAG TPA: hypothetical protein VLZ12_12425 [Verrucomicrobiae bacterium]|nr:hypothetical protein [Verrucomicrobiae bacterium]